METMEINPDYPHRHFTLGGEIDNLQKDHVVFSYSPITLKRVVDSIEGVGARLHHLESRQEMGVRRSLSFLVEYEGTDSQVEAIHEVFDKDEAVRHPKVKGQVPASTEWFPRHVSDLDNCAHLITKFNPELDQGHPGFSDMEYRARREEIANIAFDYKFAHPIPRVEYTDKEVGVWKSSYNKIKSYFPEHACSKHKRSFRMFEDAGIFTDEHIPQLEDVSNFLKKHSGFSLRPVAGLLTARDFLASLAFRVFQCTQYTRHPASPEHSPEPDIIHELLGHVPMLLDEEFARFSQLLGLASLGISDEDIERLATVYWFTVEFGLCKEPANGKQQGSARDMTMTNGDPAALKAYGAGLLSSFGELTHAMSPSPKMLPFEVERVSVQEYQDATYQPLYFVVETFEDMLDKVRDFASKLKRPFVTYFDAYTQTIQVLDSASKFNQVSRRLKQDWQNFQKQNIFMSEY